VRSFTVSVKHSRQSLVFIESPSPGLISQLSTSNETRRVMHFGIFRCVTPQTNNKTRRGCKTWYM